MSSVAMASQPCRKRLEGRLTLHKKNEPAPVNALLPGNEHPEITPDLTDEQAFEVSLWHARNIWDVRRRQLPQDVQGWLRGGGLSGGRKLDKTEADRFWSEAKAAFAREGCHV